jgi:hypothetical protein
MRVRLCAHAIFRVYFVIPHRDLVYLRSTLVKFDLKYFFNLLTLLKVIFL